MRAAQNLTSELPCHLETVRLRLGCPQAGDGEEFNAAVLEPLPQLHGSANREPK